MYFSSTFNFFSVVLDTWKEYKENREANHGPLTVNPFHKCIRFGGNDGREFVLKERMDIKRKKVIKYIPKKEKIKMIKMTITII